MTTRKVKKMNTESFISALITHLGITKTEFARKAGWTKQRVQHLCKNEAGFDVRKLAELRKNLKISKTEINLVLSQYLD
jgi:hypothetical protein